MFVRCFAGTRTKPRKSLSKIAILEILPCLFPVAGRKVCQELAVFSATIWGEVLAVPEALRLREGKPAADAVLVVVSC